MLRMDEVACSSLAAGEESQVAARVGMFSPVVRPGSADTVVLYACVERRRVWLRN